MLAGAPVRFAAAPPPVSPVAPIPDHLPDASVSQGLLWERSHQNRLATVSNVSIHSNRGGATRVDVATTRSIPYHFFSLGRPPRLVLDLDDAQRGRLPSRYSVRSMALREIRVGQWKSLPSAVVRVVADLEGWPAFQVRPQVPGVRIDLIPREFVPRPIRNPFAYFSPGAIARRYPSRVMAQNGALPHATPAAPIAPPTNLSYLGYALMAGAPAEAIIGDGTQIRLLRQGDVFQGHYQILLITSHNVEIEDLDRNRAFWLKINPAE
jgi:hypothetical protein